MTKIKLCGLANPYDIKTANILKPDYIGFVFYPKSPRYITPSKAAELKALLSSDIQAVGVFVNEDPNTIARLLREDILDVAQLHGGEDNTYIRKLRLLTDKPIFQAYRIRTEEDLSSALDSEADEILLDSGAGTGRAFDWNLLKNIKRRYFLAGGLEPANVEHVIRQFHPYGVDVSSGIETNGRKDKDKMAKFVAAVRKEGNL